MEEEQLLLTRHDEIKECIKRQSRRDMLNLSLALRQLLLDETRLIDIPNKKFRLKILFEVGLSTKEREAEMNLLDLPTDMQLHFLSVFPPNETKKQIGRDKFLAFPIVKFEKYHFTVKNIIQFCANKLGGVHFDLRDKDSELNASIRKMGDVLNRIGLPNVFSCLILIGAVTYHALIPLIEKIKLEKKLS